MQIFVVTREEIAEDGATVLVCEAQEVDAPGSVTLYDRQGRIVKYVPDTATIDLIA